MIILDLDNCISDDGWRIPLIKSEACCNNARFEQYHAHCFFDEPNFTGLERVLAEENYCIITSRPEAYRFMTRRWLKEHGLQPRQLFMRADDDHRHGVETKREHAEALQAMGVHIKGAFDDRPDIIEMYFSLGIAAERRQLHNKEYPQWIDNMKN